MKTSLAVKDRAEGRAISRALENKTVRAFVVTMGILESLPSDRARKRVVRFVDDYFEENDAQYVSVFRP